ncbi:MAG: hypothetical protein GKR96_07145 [Gammaproteobacteria bacterium]|nr:hypothetical protein [Gammaproteobacteria bacterium]
MLSRKRDNRYKVKLIVDTHLHIYPLYDVPTALNEMITNLHRLGPDAIKVACLTERSDCYIFNELRDNPSSDVVNQFNITTNDDDSLSISFKDSDAKGDHATNENQQVHLLPGQQIITSERIEVLALNTTVRVEEGLSAKDTVTAVLKSGGIPVVAWSPGKWFGKRGKIVGELIDHFAPEQMALGDTTLRPYFWLTPLLMRKAKHKGFKVLCGSDPLPFQGEENKPGSYASIISQQQPRSPSQVIRSLLNSDIDISAMGKRGSFMQVIARVLSNERVRQK